jgi:Xaa-Pro aminopeptidase
MRSSPIPARLFKSNRSRLASLLSPGSVAVIGSGESQLRYGDQYYPFRPTPGFFYLTGISLEECLLVLSPGHSDPGLREILFIKKPSLKTELWRGHVPGPGQVQKLSGINQVRWMEERDATLEQLISDETHVYTDQVNGKESYPHTSPLAPLLQRLRSVKQQEEIAEIQKAISITRSAFLRALKHIRPGLFEYQVEAEIIGELIGKGSEGHAFDPIIACGKNALVLHYTENNCRCGEGEMLLMDFGAEVNYYVADCSRTIPVSGHFTRRQKQLYDAVLRIFRQARELMVPGVLMDDFHQAVGKMWEEEHLSLGLYTPGDVEANRGSEPLWKNYFMHGTSHSMGLEVHDPFDRQVPFQPGMVFTCEPAIYIAEERVGIRLENDILITGKGPVDLMESIPIEADEIEDLMNSTTY